MTGVAHAEGQGEDRTNLTDSLRTSAKAPQAHRAPQAAPKAPVRNVVRQVRHDVQATTASTAAPVREHAQPVVRTTKTVVRAAATPVVKQVSRTARSTVSETVTRTRSVLAKTPAKPALETFRNTVQKDGAASISVAESSTRQGNSASKRQFRPTSATLVPMAVEATEALAPATLTQPDPSSASTDSRSPVDGPLDSPSAPGPCASPSGSGSSSVTPVGIAESSGLTVPTVTDDLRSGRLARLPGGPAYEPGSSPD